MKCLNKIKQITKQLQSATFVTLITLISSIFLFPNVVSAQKILKYSDHEPLGNMRTKFLKEVFFPAIEKESNGRLKIEDHWDGEIAIAYDAFGAVKEGSKTDIATVVPEYKASELPLHQIFKSFLVGPSGAKQVSSFRKVYHEVPAFSVELDNNNMVAIFLSTGYPVGFYSREKLNSLDEIKGNKWRTASFWHFDYLQNAGATSVRIEWGPAVYKALQDKTLDGIMVNVDSGYDLKVYESAPYLLASKDLWLGHLYLVAINKDTWSGLDEQDKEAIKRAAETSYKTLGKVMDNGFKTQMETLRKEGTTIRILKKAEVNTFKKATKVEEVQDKWAQEQKAKGIEAPEILEKVRTILKEY